MLYSHLSALHLEGPGGGLVIVDMKSLHTHLQIEEMTITSLNDACSLAIELKPSFPHTPIGYFCQEFEVYIT
jgi:hypothetical protein